MSVTICWRPTNERNRFEHGTSSSLEAVKEACGSTLNATHIPILRGMALVSRDGLFTEIADKIEQVGEIEIWGEW